MAGHPSPGRGPWGRAPGWVPGAHKSRPGAQDRRGEKAGKRDAYRGIHGSRGAQQRDCTAVQNTGFFGVQEGETNAARVGGTAIFFLGEE